MKAYHLPVVVETDEDGIFIVSCPVFKGCHTYGKTFDEALENLKEVIEICITEQPPEENNKFIGIREMEFRITASA
ncbi:MAG: type II toxin-antitoxin system HicB family antitoxin [Chitinophagales bacterium]|nr:type II toxin-antitoxin system HicB family antitoxin [Chitinophagales bacterium]